MKKVLIIDDNEVNLKILGMILSKAKYKVDAIVNPTFAIDEILKNPPDIILLDVSMPEIDGFKLCSLIKHNEKIRNIPIIFVTMHSGVDYVIKGFEYGAVDYITKPYNAEEIKARIATHLRMQELQNKLFEMNKNLERLVYEKIVKITDIQMETIYSVLRVCRTVDDKHLQRIRRYCYILAQKLQQKNLVDEKFVKDIFNASPLYCIGKSSNGEYTPQGTSALSEVLKKFPDSTFIKMAVDITKSFAENFDGTGVPSALTNNEIPLSARVLKVALAFINGENILEGKGTKFSPEVVDAFIASENLFNAYSDDDDDELIG